MCAEHFRRCRRPPGRVRLPFASFSKMSVRRQVLFSPEACGCVALKRGGMCGTGPTMVVDESPVLIEDGSGGGGAEVGGGNVFVQRIQLRAYTLIRWSVEVEQHAAAIGVLNHDIELTVTFDDDESDQALREEDSKTGDGAHHRGTVGDNALFAVSPHRVRSADGNFLAPFDGLLTLTLSNTFAWLTPKTVALKLWTVHTRCAVQRYRYVAHPKPAAVPFALNFLPSTFLPSTDTASTARPLRPARAWCRRWWSRPGRRSLGGSAATRTMLSSGTVPSPSLSPSLSLSLPLSLPLFALN